MQSFPQTVSEGPWALPPFHRMNSTLVSLHSTVAPFSCPLVKKKKDAFLQCLFTYETYHILLNLKVPLEIKNGPLRISKVPFSYFQRPVLFLA